MSSAIYDKIANEVVAKLKSVLVNMLVNNQSFKQSKQITNVLENCTKFGIDPADIIDNIDPTEISSDIIEFKDAMRLPNNFVKIASKIVNKATTLISLPSYEFIKENVIRFQGGSISIDAEISPNSITLRPFVKFMLVTEGIRKEILKVKFEIISEASISDFEIIRENSKKILKGNLHVKTSVTLLELKTLGHTLGEKMDLGSKVFDIDLFKYALSLIKE